MITPDHCANHRSNVIMSYPSINMLVTIDQTLGLMSCPSQVVESLASSFFCRKAVEQPGATILHKKNTYAITIGERQTLITIAPSFPTREKP